jgi:hypothetical protein
MLSHPCLWRRIAPNHLLPAIGCALLLACGCATPEEPTARRIIIPQAITDLQAGQQGPTVILRFALPVQDTRKESLAAVPAVEIYRGEAPPGAATQPPNKIRTQLLYTIPGEMIDSYRADGQIVYRDAIDPAELARAANGAEMLRVYTVRTRAARNRPSAESNRVIVRIHPAPQPVSNIRVQSAGQSVTVEWPRQADSSYRVYRAEIAPESAAAAASDASKAVLRMPLVQVAQIDANGGGPDALRYQDENVQLGHAYLYIVRGVAKFDAETIESADSMPAVIMVVEAVPPSAPQEVSAVVVEATANTPAYVSLSWAIESEPGVAGYSIYRSEQAGERGIRLNESVSAAPTYRDATVAAGRRYFYTVTAVDGKGRESAASPPVMAELPGAQP